MIKETAAVEETPPEDAPSAEPAPDIGTDLTGPGGPDGFNIGRSKPGAGGGGAGLGGAPRSRWGWYAGQVQKTIADAMRRNPKLRQAALSAQVRVWADANGRITRVTLVRSTGNPDLDDTITSEALRGVQLAEGPPQGMPMPINLKLTARRPD